MRQQHKPQAERPGSSPATTTPAALRTWRVFVLAAVLIAAVGGIGYLLGGAAQSQPPVVVIQPAPAPLLDGQPVPSEPFGVPANRQPVLVPDVQEPLPQIVFARQGNIWRSNNGAAQQLTTFDTQSFAEDPAFSPDGQQIAFTLIENPPITATVPIPVSSLYVANNDGSEMRQVWKPDTDANLSSPAWSPDGTSIYVVSNGSQPAPDGNGTTLLLQIVRIDLATGERQPMLENALDPTFSVDGAQLAYLKLSDDSYTMSLEIAQPDGSGSQPLLVADNAFTSFYAPRFSPDGKQLIFAAIGGPETDANGQPIGGMQQPWLLDQALRLVQPATAAAHGLPWDLWSISTDGTGLRRLTVLYEDLPMAAFAPDGSQVVVMGSGGMYLMRPDGSQLRRIDQLGDHGGVDWAKK